MLQAGVAQPTARSEISNLPSVVRHRVTLDYRSVKEVLGERREVLGGYAMRCAACGKDYGRTEMVMVNVTGLQEVDPLCPSCTRVWNDRADNLDAEPTVVVRQRYEDFKKERRVIG
jgi:Zn-finger nucleic acid-binding protein